MTPLHIEIALHYHCRIDQFEMVTTNDTRREYALDLVRAGLLAKKLGENGSLTGFIATDGLGVLVEALCSTPFPVKRWVMPSPSPTISFSGDGE